jgi:hypothetical protein
MRRLLEQCSRVLQLLAWGLETAPPARSAFRS